MLHLSPLPEAGLFPQAQRRVRILSLQLSELGVATYSRQMRTYFADSRTCAMDSLWWDERRQWQERLFRRLLVLDDVALRSLVKGSWVRRQNLDFHRFRQDYGPAFTVRGLLARSLRQSRYNILHFHPQSLSHASLDIIRRIPTVLQTDMTAVQLSQDMTAVRWRWTFAPNIALDRRAFQAAQRIIAWSEWAAQSVRDDYGVEPSKVCVIHPGVDLECFASGPRSQRSGRVKLLFAGNDFKRKGGHDLLAVFLSHLSESAELHLMTNSAIECGHPHVHIHKGVTAFSPAWRDLYAEADIFVLPTYFEGLPMACVEASAASLPIISTRICGIPEIVVDGENGFLVTPGCRSELAQALLSLIRDTSLRQEMGRRGRRIAERSFNAATNFQQVETLFREMAVSVDKVCG